MKPKIKTPKIIETGKINMYRWNYGNIPISELKEFVDAQLKEGATFVQLDIGWGYYDDIDSIEIVATKVETPVYG